MDQDAVILNWVLTAYSLLRDREESKLSAWMLQANNTSFHEGVKEVYGEDGRTYPHQDTLTSMQEEVKKARADYEHSRNQTNQLLYYFLKQLA